MQLKFLSFLCLLATSTLLQAQMSSKFYFVRGDTLMLKSKNCDSVNLLTEYSTWHNFKYPKYFLIKDTLDINSNNDGNFDKLLILSPRFQEHGIYDNDCDDSLNNRLLLFFKKRWNSYLLTAINPNVIPNSQDYPSEPYNKIERNDKTITLVFFTGSSRKCKYSFIFTKVKNRFTLNQITSDCYKIDLSKQIKKIKKYSYSEKRDLRLIDLKKHLMLLNENMNL